MSSQIVAKVFSDYVVNAGRGDVLELVEVPMCCTHGGEQRMFDVVEKAMEGTSKGDEIEMILSAKVELWHAQGEVKPFIGTKYEDGLAAIHGNNPPVGKNLTYRVIIHVARDATEKEIETGKPSMPSLH